MDVDLLLADLRANVQEALHRVYAVGLETEDTDLLRDIAEDFDNLDVWLSRDGFLPSGWQRGSKV